MGLSVLEMLKLLRAAPPGGPQEEYEQKMREKGKNKAAEDQARREQALADRTARIEREAAEKVGDTLGLP